MAVGVDVVSPTDVLPPDRADQAPITGPLREILGHLRSSSHPDHRPTLEITLDTDAYDKARTYFQRPYRAQPSQFCMALSEGTVWFRREKVAGPQPDAEVRYVYAGNLAATAPTPGQLHQAAWPVDVPPGGVTLSSVEPQWLASKIAESRALTEGRETDGKAGSFVSDLEAAPVPIRDATPPAERADYGVWTEKKETA